MDIVEHVFDDLHDRPRDPSRASRTPWRRSENFFFDARESLDNSRAKYYDLIGFHPYETRGVTVAVKKKSAKKTSKKVAKKKPAKTAAKKAKRK